MVHLSWDQVNNWRMARQYLSKRAARKNRFDVVSAIGALQAQMMSAAELQLWARVDDLAHDDVEEALWTDRTLVKTWASRGTLHLLNAKDLPLYTAVFSTLKRFRRDSALKYYGVTLDELDALIEGVRDTLTDTGLTREALAEAMVTHMNAPHLRDMLLSGWGGLLKPVAFQGYLCFGPNAGKNVTFVKPERWIGQLETVESSVALQEMLRRFLAAYGPATAPEFARWHGMEQADARKAFNAMGDEIEAVDVEGWRAFALSGEIKKMHKAAVPSVPVVRLLPNFDMYTLAVAPHFKYLMPEALKLKVYRPQGWISPVVVVDGRILGVWEYNKQKNTVAVQVDLFAPVSDDIKHGTETEGQRLARFVLADDTAKLQLEFA